MWSLKTSYCSTLMPFHLNYLALWPNLLHLEARQQYQYEFLYLPHHFMNRKFILTIDLSNLLDFSYKFRTFT